MKNVLLIGDYTLAQWHPLHGVDDQIQRILADEFSLKVTEDYPSLTLPDLQQYDLVVDYCDAWQERGTADFAGNLIAYVALGGSLLVLHGGIICRTNPEMEQMIGGSFTGHPDKDMLRYETICQHPITAGISSFEIVEEPYRFVIDPIAKLTILMEYLHQGERYPAAWLRVFGKGKLVYLSIGHNAESFIDSGFADLIRQSSRWCVQE